MGDGCRQQLRFQSCDPTSADKDIVTIDSLETRTIFPTTHGHDSNEAKPIFFHEYTTIILYSIYCHIDIVISVFTNMKILLC